MASIHPFELTYFNVLAGGPMGGRHILSDSNLDWGQGLKGLARLQRSEPEFRDLTLYYFGDTDPAYYGVRGACLRRERRGRPRASCRDSDDGDDSVSGGLGLAAVGTMGTARVLSRR